jgi:tripartite-type tricarboxylate transporter receptor subunit TctC
MQRYAAALLIFSSVTAAGLAHGADYPSRPVRMIIPFPPGGNVDVFGRVMFRYVEKELGQPIVIDNRGGANGILGSDLVAKATPDGYTMLDTSFAFAVNPAIRKQMPFDVIKDFAPVTNIAVGLGYLMVAHPSVPAKTVAELIALSKKQPIRYSSAGVANGQHLAGALFNHMAGVDILHVPYKGGGPAVTAVLGGEVHLHFPAPAVGIPHVKGGRLRALGFTGAKRLDSMPDVPAIGETVKGYVSDAGWHAIFAPAKTPPAILKRMQTAISAALKVPEVRSHFVNNGYEPQGDPPEVWAKKYRAEVARFAEIARAAKIEPQ